MAIKAFADFNCSVAQPLAFLGERWSLLVLRDLFLGRRHFEEFQESLGLATNVLSQRLATLVEEGIVERRRYNEHPERFDYRLTEKAATSSPCCWRCCPGATATPPAPAGRRWRPSTTTAATPSTWSRPARTAAARSTPETSTTAPGRVLPRSSGAAPRPCASAARPSAPPPKIKRPLSGSRA
jgi:DNA-binding HxlR family transcriptional regulator